MKKMIILTPEEKEDKFTKLADALIRSVVSTMKSKIYAFIPIFEMLDFVPVKQEIFVCTDGEKIYYNGPQIIEAAKKRNLKMVENTLFHIFFHGLLGHFEETYWKDKEIAWIMQDLQVERCFSRMCWDELFINYLAHWDEYICDELYYEALRDKKVRKKVLKLGKKIYRDDHRFWYVNGQKRANEKDSNEDGEEGSKTIKIWGQARVCIGMQESLKGEHLEAALLGWVKNTMYSKWYGSCGMDEENMVELKGKSKNTYQEIMDKITKICENVKEEQELDKVLYQYGLELYGDVPLVEPEELSEKKKLHTIVFAVDTSGSCTDRAKKFFAEMIAVFDEIRKVGQVEHISYLECDTKIAFEKNYYSLQEFVNFGNKHTFYGGGGTSFVPVFKYADALVEKGEQVDALFYITDGFGNFPEYKESPEYPVYILLDEDEHMKECLPKWCECILLKD